MPRPRRKEPLELLREAFWSRMDIARLFRKSPRTIDRYIHHLNPGKRLPGLIINGEFYAEKAKVLAYFAYRPFGSEAGNQSPSESTLTRPAPDSVVDGIEQPGETVKSKKGESALCQRSN